MGPGPASSKGEAGLCSAYQKGGEVMGGHITSSEEYDSHPSTQLERQADSFRTRIAELERELALAKSAVADAQKYGDDRCKRAERERDENAMLFNRAVGRATKAERKLAEAKAELEWLRTFEPRITSESTPVDVKIVLAKNTLARLVEGLDAMNGDANYTVTHARCGDREYEIVVRRKDKPTDDELRKVAEARLLQEQEAVRVLGHAVAQLRGALILDHMTQGNGKMYGTTVQALEAAKVCEANPIASAAIKGEQA